MGASHNGTANKRLQRTKCPLRKKLGKGMRVSNGQILLKNSIKSEACFSATDQTIVNFP
jgi:hypothetical protein